MSEIEKERAAFEAWITKEKPQLNRRDTPGISAGLAHQKASAWEGWQARAAATQVKATLSADDSDMVWPDYDTETFHHSIDDAVDYEVDQAWPTAGPLELKLQLAKRIPNVTVRIFNISENGHEWEIVDAIQGSPNAQSL